MSHIDFTRESESPSSLSSSFSMTLVYTGFIRISGTLNDSSRLESGGNIASGVFAGALVGGGVTTVVSRSTARFIGDGVVGAGLEHAMRAKRAKSERSEALYRACGAGPGCVGVIREFMVLLSWSSKGHPAPPDRLAGSRRWWA